MKPSDSGLYREPKKTKQADLELLRPLLLSVGLCSSLLIVIAAFQIKSYEKNELVSIAKTSNDFEEIIEVPPTEIQPPPPTLQLPQVVEVPNDTKIVQDIEVNFDVEISTDTKLQQITITEPTKDVEIEKEDSEEIFMVVEESAAPTDGMESFYKLASENLRYPSQARRMNVEGKVFVEFVVAKDGTLTNIKIVKGIGAGCDEEALRIVQLSPKWKAAKQRGKPVKQRIVLPIFFKLKQV
ncbi:MAG: energy transducer TonB [Cyclobacteriaceae bacterium]|jgi:protein TonB|nr:energy transducer TonB [Cyclobacteriaceae bacterium]